MKRLSDLSPGETGILSQIHCAGKIRRRLLDLGVTPGCVITYLRRAPFSGPIEYYVRGYRLAMRLDMAQAIYLDEPGGDCCEATHACTGRQSKLRQNHAL